MNIENELPLISPINTWVLSVAYVQGGEGLEEVRELGKPLFEKITKRVQTFLRLYATESHQIRKEDS